MYPRQIPYAISTELLRWPQGTHQVLMKTTDSKQQRAEFWPSVHAVYLPPCRACRNVKIRYNHFDQQLGSNLQGIKCHVCIVQNIFICCRNTIFKIFLKYGQWWIQVFPEEAPSPKGGTNLLFDNIFWKTT